MRSPSSPLHSTSSPLHISSPLLTTNSLPSPSPLLTSYAADRRNRRHPSTPLINDNIYYSDTVEIKSLSNETVHNIDRSIVTNNLISKKRNFERSTTVQNRKRKTGVCNFGGRGDSNETVNFVNGVSTVLETSASNAINGCVGDNSSAVIGILNNMNDGGRAAGISVASRGSRTSTRVIGSRATGVSASLGAGTATVTPSVVPAVALPPASPSATVLQLFLR